MAKRKTKEMKAPVTDEQENDVLDEIIAFLKSDKKEQVAVFTHKTPDPDAIGAACGIQWLLKKYGVFSRVFYDGEISHPQNRTLVNVLELSLYSSEEYKEQDFPRRVIVDATTANTPLEEADLVLDHHRHDENNAKFSLVEHVGAACTLVWELVERSGFAFEDDIDETAATALLFGIRNDTNDLISETTTDRDFRAARYLSEHVNRKKLTAVINYSLPAYFFELERELNSGGNSKIEHGCFVGSVGVITPSKRDSLPMLADKMVRREGIETSIVFAIVGDELQASVRSQNTSLDVNVFCQTVFGKQHSGGKLGAGAACVPLGLFAVDGLPDDLSGPFWEALKNKLFYQIIHIAKGN